LALCHADAMADDCAEGFGRRRSGAVRSEELVVGTGFPSLEIDHRHVMTYAGHGEDVLKVREHFEHVLRQTRRRWTFTITENELLIKQTGGTVYVALQLPVDMARPMDMRHHSTASSSAGLGLFPVWNCPHVTILYNAAVPSCEKLQWQLFWEIRHWCMLHLRGDTSFFCEDVDATCLRISPSCQLHTQLRLVHKALVVGMKLQEEGEGSCPSEVWDDFHITWFFPSP